MTEKILVPDHVAAEVEAEAKKETEKESETDTAFVMLDLIGNSEESEGSFVTLSGEVETNSSFLVEVL